MMIIPKEKMTIADLPKKFSLLQNDILTGNMLGDGGVYMEKGAKNARYILFQHIKNKCYVQYIADQLEPFSRGVKIRSPRKNAPNYYCGVQSCSNLLFTELRQKWYFNGRKIVPKDIVLNDRIMAIWACDDGSNNAPKKQFVLSTQSFNLDDVLFLKERIKNDLDIKCNIHKNQNKWVIYFGSSNYFKLIETIGRHIVWDCFSYKIDISSCPITNPKLGRKLTKDAADEIRNLYANGHSARHLAKVFKVHFGSIYRIIRGDAYS